MCVKSHILHVLAAQRRRLGLSQQDLAARAGLRREKVNRVESKGEDLGFEDMCRLLDAVGLVLVVQEKSAELASSSALPLSHQARALTPRPFEEASFIDGSKAKILNWGKVPK